MPAACPPRLRRSPWTERGAPLTAGRRPRSPARSHLPQVPQVPLLLALALATGSCLIVPAPPSPPPAAVVPLYLAADPPDVEIYLDGQYMGQLDRWRDATLPTTPGVHRLELRRAGYFPLRRTIEVGPQGTSLAATLRKYPDFQ